MQERHLEFWDDDEWKAITSDWPEAVTRGFAERLRIVQLGGKPASRVKPLKGFGITVYEMWHRDGQRIVYTVEYASLTNYIYVLDAFEKDSADGRKMRTADKKRIEGRVRDFKTRMEALSKASNSPGRGLH